MNVLLHRAAMKMANMDSAFDFMFTNPKNDRGVSDVCINELMFNYSAIPSFLTTKGNGNGVQNWEFEKSRVNFSFVEGAKRCYH